MIKTEIMKKLIKMKMISQEYFYEVYKVTDNETVKKNF